MPFKFNKINRYQIRMHKIFNDPFLTQFHDKGTHKDRNFYFLIIIQYERKV